MKYSAQKEPLINILILLFLPIFLITIAGCGGGGSNGGRPTPEGVTISWIAPTQNADGSRLTDLAGYKIYYGPATSNYTGGSIDVGLKTSYDTRALSAGYYCFVVASYDFSGNESGYSGELCKNLI